MKVPFRQKLRYRFELFLNKGGSSVFLSILIVFICGFLFLAGLRLLILKIFPDSQFASNYGESIWITFLQMTDPGSMSIDDPSPLSYKIVAIIAGIIGISILSMFIAVITASLEKVLYNFRKGRGMVIETGHTLILGWNERVINILDEIINANESEKKASIVILSDEDKEHMDDLITKRIQDTKTSRVITTNGNISNAKELRRVNAKDAKSIIIMASCSERACDEAKVNSDVQTIKTIMAVISTQQGKNGTPIIVEIFTEEKREIADHFTDNQIIAVDSWDIMGRLLMQTSLTSGLEVVYGEILSFNGAEIYFYKEEWGDMGFYDLIHHFKDGIPLGIYNNTEGIILRPPAQTKLKPEDSIIILAEDDSTIHYSTKRLYDFSGVKLKRLRTRLEKRKSRILILGWHFVAGFYVREANEYMVEGSVFDIMFNQPTKELEEIIDSLKIKYPGFEINLIDSNPLKYEHLESVKPETYDNIIILSQSLEENSPDKIDSDTLIILLLLRKNIIPFGNTKIITQVLNSENQEIITQTDVDDFIISNKLITMIIAQISEDPRIKLFYDDIFCEEGSEIYIKSAALYFDTFPQILPFIDIIQAARNRDEICIGIQKGNSSRQFELNFGVELNIPKERLIEIHENDYLVVLSEDEL